MIQGITSGLYPGLPDYELALFQHDRYIKALTECGVDATMEDALYTGLDEVAEIVSNGEAVAGTIYDMMPEESQNALDEADVILAKGQGNYESMSGQGRHVFYEFLCECDLFTNRFHVPKLTGMFLEEGIC